MPTINQVSLTVAPGWGQFSSIADALAAAALEAATDNRMLITIYPGTYAEAPLVVPDYVTLFAPGRHETTRIVPSSAASHAITLGTDCELIGLRVKWAAQSDPNTAAYYVPPGQSDIELHDCFATNADIGFLIESSAGSIAARQINILGGTSTSGIKVTNNATFEVSDFMLTGGPTVTNCVTIDSGSLQLSNVKTNTATTFGTGLNISGTGEIYANGLILRSDGTGVGISCDGTRSHVTACLIDNVATGVSTDNGADLNISGLDVENATTDILTQHMSDTLIVAGGHLSRQKLSLHASSSAYLTFLDDSISGDESVVIIGENATGLPGRGSETIMGEGDSYNWDMEVHQYDASAPGGSRFTSVTTEARSQTGSTFGFAAGAAVGDCLYIANPLPFPGIKMSVATALVAAAGPATDLICEIWDGAAWDTVTTMDRDSSYPFGTRGKLTFETLGSAQVRFNPLALTTWTADDNVVDEVPNYGQDMYVFRIRILGQAPTVAPLIEYFKVHTNRLEVNSGGEVEHFGQSRKWVSSPPIQPENLVRGPSFPANEDVVVSPNITLQRERNEFTAGALDQTQGCYNIPDSVDTSAPLRVDVAWFKLTAGGGAVEWQLDVALVSEGDLLNGTLPETAYIQTVTVPGGTKELTITTFDVNIEDTAPYMLGFRLYRDGGNGGDTYGFSAILDSIVLTTLRWQ